MQGITSENMGLTLDSYLLFIDSNLDGSISQDEIIKAELTPWFNGSLPIDKIKGDALSLLSKPFNPISKDYCQQCVPRFKTTDPASCSYNASSFEDLFGSALQCIYDKRISSNRRKRQFGEFLVPAVIIGLINIAVAAATLPAIERSCRPGGSSRFCTNPEPVRMTIDGRGCTGHYNSHNIKFYFDQLLHDLHGRFRSIDTGSKIFQAAFPNVKPGSVEAKTVQACFTKILDKSAKRALDITIDKCDQSRTGAAYDPNSGRYQLFGLFASAPYTKLRADFAKNKDNSHVGKINFLGNDVGGNLSKLGALFHEMTHRFCSTNDKLKYVNEYGKWKTASAAQTVKNADNYRVFYELMMST